MGFNCLNASILKKLCVLSLSTIETRYTPQCSPSRLQESFWNLKIRNLVLICTATSLEVRYRVLHGQDQIFRMPYQFCPNPVETQIEDTERWLEE